MKSDISLHCTLAAVRCIVIAPVCGRVCVLVGLFYGPSAWNKENSLTVTRITWSCMHRSSQTGSVGKGSDHLQLIKFLAVPRPRDGGPRRGKNFRLCLTTASVQCLRLLRAFFFHYHYLLSICSLVTAQHCWETSTVIAVDGDHTYREILQQSHGYRNTWCMSCVRLEMAVVALPWGGAGINSH